MDARFEARRGSHRSLPSPDRPWGRCLALGAVAALLLTGTEIGAAPRAPAAVPFDHAPRSARDFDALLPLLSSPAEAIRRRVCTQIQETSSAQRDLYLRRLTAHPFRTYTETQRMLFLRAGIQLPGPSGWFNIPKLKPGERPPDAQDMLDALIRRPPPRDDLRRLEAYRRALETLCVLRGLGRLRDTAVAEPLIRFAFTPYGITFRWEVIRAVRSLGGYAIPALLKLTRLRVRDWRAQRTRFLVRRLAYHLQTSLPQANPAYALTMADRSLQRILLRAYGKYRHADAVEAILALTDHDDPELRQAARRALTQYFVGKAPKARMKRLKLPGGQESDHVQKLYLSYRERATHEVRQALERITRGRYDRSIPGRELLRLLFAEQDRLRATRWHRTLEQALEAERAGDAKQAEALAEQVLRHAPGLPGRRALFPLLQRRAARLARAGRLREAAGLLDRAVALLEAGAAETALAQRAAAADAAYLRALWAEAQGDTKAAVALHRQALLIWPEHGAAQVALLHLAPEPRFEPALGWALVLLAALGLPVLLWVGSTLRRVVAE